MSTLVCPRCSRSNPTVAVYCYYDGVVLRQGAPGAAPMGQFLHPFKFPSGRSCRSLDELAKGCLDEWEDARDLLRAGRLDQHFTSIGRVDLARAAQEARRQADSDIGLYHFLSNLPVENVQRPQLDLSPRRINLGTLRPGESREIPLQIFNLGRGFLQGKVAITEGKDYVHLQDETGAVVVGGEYQLHKTGKQAITVRVETRDLAAPNSYHARLTVISNGGIAEVPVRFELDAVPFAYEPYQGVATPRAMAERMRDNPKPGVPLLESGEIQRWFADNGWTFPVQGETAKGVAAVQQFFEGMGLSKAPTVQVNESEFHLICLAPEVASKQVTLFTSAKKWVYAQVESDSHWLIVGTPHVSGPRQAPITFDVDSSLLDPNQIYEGNLTITANAGQTLHVHVTVEVKEPHVPFTRRLLRPFFGGALIALLYRLCFVLPWDIYARVLAAPKSAPSSGKLGFWMHSPSEASSAYLRNLVIATWWVGTLIGFFLLRKYGSRKGDMLSGALAGTMAGIAAALTIGSLIMMVDGLPRGMLSLLFSRDSGGGMFLSMLVWILIALIGWAMIGAIVGFVLTCVGSWGRKVWGTLAYPIRGLFRILGWKRMADYLAIS